MVIIKGAIYTDGETLLRAHYTGDFNAVDCTEYKKKAVIKSDYDKETAQEFLKGFYLKYEGEKYFECEYSPYHTSNLSLLSDLSEIEYFDEETSF